MKGHAQVVQALNEILVAEITSVNQYFLAAKLADHRGYARLGRHVYKESLAEMKHAEQLIERILYLDGLPNLQKLEKVRIAGDVIEQLRLDLAGERKTVAQVNKAIETARKHADNGTADLLEALLEGAEDHVEWLERQLELVKQLGEEQYLAQQIHRSE